MSTFKNDLANEAILGSFLDKQYKKANIKIERTNNLELQHRGIDFILTDSNNLQFKVDEKAQLHYLNQSLPTFALEIDYLKDNKLKPGWLFDPSKITEIYAFIFNIQLTVGLDKLNSSDNIKSCEVVFVNRIKLINELSLLNIDINFCLKQSNILREGNLQKRSHESGFNFQISNHLAEKPVNLIVKKAFLADIGKSFSFG